MGSWGQYSPRYFVLSAPAKRQYKAIRTFRAGKQSQHELHLGQRPSLALAHTQAVSAPVSAPVVSAGVLRSVLFDGSLHDPVHQSRCLSHSIIFGCLCGRLGLGLGWSRWLWLRCSRRLGLGRHGIRGSQRGVESERERETESEHAQRLSEWERCRIQTPLQRPPGVRGHVWVDG